MEKKKESRKELFLLNALGHITNFPAYKIKKKKKSFSDMMKKKILPKFSLKSDSGIK